MATACWGDERAGGAAVGEGSLRVTQLCPPRLRSTELDLPYPDLQEFIADMNFLMALIINGPM